MRRLKVSTTILGAVILVLLTGGLLPAADYPTKPVQIIVGFPAGGIMDLAARTLAEASKPFFPKPFMVVNKPGGGSILGTSEMAKSPPDGYTLGMVDISALAVGPHLQANLPYKGPEDVEYIISCVMAQVVFVVRADAPWKTMKDMIDYAKANPGKLRIGNSGISSTTHLHFMSLKLAGVPMTEVPFTGGPQSVAALLGGHIEGLVLNPANAMPHIKAGTLKFLGLFTEERVNDVPELKGVPTFKELGYNVITEGTPYFVAAPKGTPQEITNMLYNVFLKAEKTDFFQKYAKDGVLAVEFKGPAELKKEAEKAYIFYRDFIGKAGLKLNK